MTDISRLMQLSNGILRGIDLAANTLVVNEIKVGGASGTTLSKTSLDALLAISSNLASTDADKGASLIGIHDETSLFTGTTVEAALAEAMDMANHAHSTADGAVGDAASAQSVADSAQTDATCLITLSGVPEESEDLGTFTGTTIPDNSTIKAAFQAIETAVENQGSMIENFTWADAVLDRVTAPPGSPAEGDRYLVKATASGAFEGKEDQIAEYNGATWDFTSPATGWMVSVVAEADGLYNYGGSSWAKKYFEATTASTGLTKVGFDIRLADVNTAGLSVSSGAFSVNVDGSSIEKGSGAGNPLQVKASGITTAMLAANAVGAAKVRLENNTYLRARNAADDGDVNICKVNASDATEFAAIPYGPSSAPSADYQFANKKYVDDQMTSGSTVTQRSVVVGETMAANSSFMVRWAVNGETAGRVYKADKDASTADKFHVCGMIQTTTELSAGNAATMVMMGSKTLKSADPVFLEADVGKPVFLDAAGAFSKTPTTTASHAVVIVGYLENTTQIDVKPCKIMGVN